MPKMRVMIVPQGGAKLRLEEREVPEPGRHEVRIRVQACGVCHSDALVVQGRMPGRMMSGKARFRVVLKVE
jgi:alcohol dehydrogenase